MSQRFNPSLLLLCFTLFAAPAVAQAPATSANNAAQPSDAKAQAALRSTTRLVQVNVIVRDKKNQPVEGLKPEDFTVLDQGQPQKITIFSSESGSAIIRTGAAASALPPNVFTNRLDRSGQVPSNVTIILFDALNTPIADQLYARQQIIRFLGGLHPEDHAAIYLLTRRLEILHEFTQDTKELLAALDRFHGRSSSFQDAATPNALDPSAMAADMFSTTTDPTQQSTQSTLQQFLNNADGALADFADIDRAETTANALEAIANHVARIPGRKSIVWVSGSFPIEIGYDGDTLTPIEREQRSFTKELEQASEALNQASIAVYPVDARGLMTPAPYSAGNRSGPINPRSRSIPQLGPNQNEFFTMNMLADRTGGKAFYNNNDIAAGARAAISDGESSYVISFYPNHGKWDGKFHELKINVNAHGAQVRYRKGYFAVAEPADKQAERKAALDAAVWSPVESTGLGLQVKVKAVEPASAHALELSIDLDTHEILMEQNEGHWRGKLEMLFLQIGQDGKFVNSENKSVTLNLDDARYKSLLQQGLHVVRHLPILPDVATVRIVIRDPQSSAMGTVTIPVKTFLPEQAAAASAPNTPPKSESK